MVFKFTFIFSNIYLHILPTLQASGRDTVFLSPIDLFDRDSAQKRRIKTTRNSFYYKFVFNRYRRRLETCPQAKTSKSGHAIFFSFFRRFRATSMTQRRVENTRVHFWTFTPVSKFEDCGSSVELKTQYLNRFENRSDGFIRLNPIGRS